MKKMYFAMIPKRSALEDALVATGVVVAAYYGAKRLLGEDKFNEYKEKIKGKVLKSEVPTNSFSSVGSDTGVGIVDDEEAAKEEESIAERIRAAARAKL